MFAACLMVLAADPAPGDVFKPLQPLVGEWKGTGTPDAAKGEKKEFWTETTAWAYRFEKGEPRLVGTVEKSPHFAKLELKYDAAAKALMLTATAPDKSTAAFAAEVSVGKQKETVLTATRTEAGTEHRLVVTLLHANRYLYRAESKPAGAKTFARLYQVGATKQGEPFAAGTKGPECIVTGGQAKTAVSYKGTTYYVCCSGCKDAFLEDPEKYIAAAKKK